MADTTGPAYTVDLVHDTIDGGGSPMKQTVQGVVRNDAGAIVWRSRRLANANAKVTARLRRQVHRVARLYAAYFAEYGRPYEQVEVEEQRKLRIAKLQRTIETACRELAEETGAPTSVPHMLAALRRARSSILGYRLRPQEPDTCSDGADEAIKAIDAILIGLGEKVEPYTPKEA